MITRNWRTSTVILACGGLMLTIALGVRHNFGLYLQPMTLELGIGREAFSIAIAIQNLLYGLAQPFTGMIADKFGAARVLIAGALLYALGLVLMSLSGTSWELNLSAGLLIGLALGCTGFSIVFGRRTLGASGKAHCGARHYRRRRLVRPVRHAAVWPDAHQFVRMAAGAPHARAYRARDRSAIRGDGRRQEVAGCAIPPPVDTRSAARSFHASLGGSAFLFHQVGSFTGVWLAGYLFDATGSYQLMWVLTIGMGVVAALLNLPIDERQIARPAVATRGA